MKKAIISLTSIRGIAALIVILYHIHDTYRQLHFFDWFKNGALGVDLFFVLSGFIMAYVYSETPLTLQTFRAFYPRFMAARLFRIYPLHLVTLISLIIFVALLPTLHDRFPTYFTGESVLLNLLLIQNWGFIGLSWNTVSWSISAEFFMYLLFPILLLVWQRLALPLWAIIGAALLTLIAHYFLIYIYDLAKYGGLSLGGMVRVCFEFSLGFTVYYMKASYGRQIHKRYRWISLLYVGIACLGLFVTTLWPLFVPAVALLILHLSQDDCPVSHFLSRPLFHYLGQISYSLYMWHWIIIQLQNWGRDDHLFELESEASFYLSSAGIIGASLLIAVLSYHFLERPTRQFGRSLFTP